MRNRVDLINHLHGTRATVYPGTVIPRGDHLQVYLSASQWRRADKALCGAAGCSCGGIYRAGINASASASPHLHGGILEVPQSTAHCCAHQGAGE